ncbi:ADP-ribosylglycohydrolase family protein [Ursidibacter sp. B-7004-1]
MTDITPSLSNKTEKEKELDSLQIELLLSSVKLARYLLDTPPLRLKAVKCEMAFGDENWITRKAIEWQRKDCLKELNKFKKESQKELEKFISILDQINGIYLSLGLSKIQFENSMPNTEFQLNHSIENDNWGMEFENCMNQFTQTIENTGITADLIEKQPLSLNRRKYMFGAITGDIIGSRFEFNNYKGVDFELFTSECCFTDDTVCTIAIAEWALNNYQDDLVAIVRKWGNKYPYAGYGGTFVRWLNPNVIPAPYNSWGNGSAMRVSSVGWLCNDIDTVLERAKQSAEITHNHPEGIKGAQAVASAIYFARVGKDKAFIKDFIEQRFAYNLNQTCDEIRPVYEFDVSCQGSVPQAIIAFLESQDFEDSIRLAVSLGGDSDTIAAITGSIAEAFYQGVPEEIKAKAVTYLPQEFLDILQQIEERK